ncbi:MAG TPA: hypothetical protein VK447_08385 [Myxococcaceae bacterium]|nr:hypothetical protein [Myxococcaceae bacterium]
MQDGKSRGPGKDEAWLDRTQQLDGPVLTPGAPPVAGVKLVCVGGPLNGK